jgi:cysteine desulfurase
MSRPFNFAQINAVSGFVDMEAVVVNGDEKQRIPGNLNISFNYVEGESLLYPFKKVD